MTRAVVTPTTRDQAQLVRERWRAAGHPLLQLRWWGAVGGSAEAADAWVAAALRSPDVHDRLGAVLAALDQLDSDPERERRERDDDGEGAG